MSAKGAKITMSIAIPTYKRLPQLKRAVEDVFAQTFKDWELVISDDEEGEGETWNWLQELSAKDCRVKILKNNRGKHGQIYNVNSACLATRGEWIKPFFDDDRMLPTCLEEFAKVVQALDSVPSFDSSRVTMIGCRGQKWRNGIMVGEDVNYSRHEIEVIPCRKAVLAHCLLDGWNGRTPTHMLMGGEIVRGGATMVEDAQFKHPLDVRWYGRLLENGGAYAMTSKVLIGECQGEVESGTSELWREEPFVTEESRRVYREIYERSQKDASWPSKRTVDGLVCGVRTLYHARLHQWKTALRYFPLMFKTLKSPFLVARWAMRRRFPGSFVATERIVVK